MNRLPLLYTSSYRCSCGYSQEVISDEPGETFLFYSLMAKVDFVNHRAFSCPLNTLKVKA